MKKLVLMLLAVLSIFAFAACGEERDYTKHTFDQLGDDFHWEMTAEDAQTYIRAHQPVKAEVTTEPSGEDTIVSDDYYVFRFGSDGKLQFVKLVMAATGDSLESLTKEYGTFDEEGDIAGSPIYYWYGTMAGQPTEMSLYCPSTGASYYLELSPEK